MSYAICESALQFLLYEVDGFTRGSVILGNHGALNSGYDQAIVIRYADFRQEDIGRADKNITWGIELAIFIRYLDDFTVHENAKLVRQNIIDKLNSHPQLDKTDGVVVSEITAGASCGAPPGGPLSNIK